MNIEHAPGAVSLRDGGRDERQPARQFTFRSFCRSFFDRNAGGRRALAVLTLLLASLFATSIALAQPASDPTPLQFADQVEERRFQMLVNELRCVMCQNQSLADSNAQIAVDLRREVLALMREGRSDSEIRQFLVERYGEFVLYRPRVGASTWLLWFGPAVVLIGGALFVLGIVRRRAPPPASSANDDQEW